MERTISWLIKRRSLALVGRRRQETGRRWFSLLVPISCSIWRFSDRV